MIGMLCGVMITAAVTYVFALPANNYHWQMEIWKRGGAVWTFDKDGQHGWKWMIEATPDIPLQKPVTVSQYALKVKSEQL